MVGGWLVVCLRVVWWCHGVVVRWCGSSVAVVVGCNGGDGVVWK